MLTFKNHDYTDLKKILVMRYNTIPLRIRDLRSMNTFIGRCYTGSK